MREEYISTGKNVDIAISTGLNIIGKNREDVDIKILEQGGLFKKAKVVLVYEKEEIVETEQETKEEINIIEVVEKNVDSVVEESETEVEELEESKIVEETKTEDVEEQQEEATEEKVKKVVDSTRLKNRVTEFLTEFLQKANVDASVTVEEKENELNFSINGENVGKLIGYRGEALNSLQFLLGNLKESGEGKIRIYLDISGYKSKREETLVDLANKMADKAEEIERNVHLDPMNAYERRVIHTALQNRELVETESTGEGNKRHVVIKFKR